MNATPNQTASSGRVLVIGAGVAGSSVAIALARRGVPVDLIEKSTFPRAKACGCCLGHRGLAALERLSLRQQVTCAGSETHTWLGVLGGQRIQFQISGGVAISREVLDPMMLRAAEQQGARVTTGCEVAIRNVDRNGVKVQLRQDGQRFQRSYGLVVCAGGLAMPGLNRHLGWIERPHGRFGVSCLVRCSEVEQGTIMMACQPDGYVGVVRLPEGDVDVAAALRCGSDAARSGSPLERMQRILNESGFEAIDLTAAQRVCTTPPLRRSRVPAAGRLLAIGDAAGYVEPFTGEGMTWAMQSGVAVAALIAEARDLDSIAPAWRKRSRELLGGQQRKCRILTGALQYDRVLGPAAAAISKTPWLASPLVQAIVGR